MSSAQTAPPLPEPRLAGRLLSLLDHLGIARAHVATQMPGDLVGLVAAAPDRVAGVVLCVPTRLDADAFAGVADRLLMIAGDSGISYETAARASARLPTARWHRLAAYPAPGWADVMADRTDEVADTMERFLAGLDVSGAASDTPHGQPSRSGTHAGITWRIDGTGPALVLLPFFLAPSQWSPAVDRLVRRFSVIRLGGAHIGGVAALEDRARSPSYVAMFDQLVARLTLPEGATVLDVGCGSGALDRHLLRVNCSVARLEAVDLNGFLISEARVLAAEAGVADRIRFTEASAEALPFADGSIDCAFSVTVLEECDADRALGEMVRVVRPGGRVGVVVRAIDLPQWWNMELPSSLLGRAETPPQSVGVTGVADRSLYARMIRAGLVDLVAFPSTVTLANPSGPIWRYREDHVTSQLTPAERAQWDRARSAAAADGVLLHAHALHCAVGRRPGG